MRAVSNNSQQDPAFTTRLARPSRPPQQPTVALFNSEPGTYLPASSIQGDPSSPCLLRLLISVTRFMGYAWEI